MTLGGRAAEELVFNEVTTGAANDLEKITHTAKQMVMRYGMSEKLGPRVLGRNHDMPFLGREMGHEPDYSEEVAREIDDEVRRIIEDGHELALKVLREHMDELHRISQILIERETIDKDQFERLLAGEAEETVFAGRTPRPPPSAAAEPERRPAAEAAAVPAARARRCSRPSPKAPTSPATDPRRELAAADRGALPAPVRDGRRQRHARLVLGRRRPPRPDAAVAAARRMLDEGAAIVDVGGESTRPGAEGVPLDEELRRVVPVLEGLAGAPVSIDTSKAEVARRALELGAELVNDVTALRGDPELAGVVAEAGAYVCLMHMRGEPRTMQAEPALRRRRLRGEGVPRGAARVRGRRGDPRGARLPRSRDRLRQDGRAQLRARAPARRARRARPAGGRRLLAQELARPDPRRSRTRRRARPRRRSAPRSRPTTAARRSCASTTCASTSRRCAPPRRWPDEGRAARPRALRPPRRARGGARDGPAVPLRRRARGRRARRDDRIEDAVDYREVAGDRARGLRRASSGCSRRSRPRSPTRWSSASRSSACACACASREVRPAGLDGRVQRPSRSSAARDAAPTSGSARTSATARRRSGARPS